MTSCHCGTARYHLLEICPVLQQIVFKQKSETQPRSPNCARDGEWEAGVTQREDQMKEGNLRQSPIHLFLIYSHCVNGATPCPSVLMWKLLILFIYSIFFFKVIHSFATPVFLLIAMSAPAFLLVIKCHCLVFIIQRFCHYHFYQEPQFCNVIPYFAYRRQLLLSFSVILTYLSIVHSLLFGKWSI